MKICNAVMRQRQCRVFLAMLRWVKGGRVGADWSGTCFWVKNGDGDCGG